MHPVKSSAIFIIVSLISMAAVATEIKFGFFDSPSARVEKFKKLLPVGVHVSGVVSSNGLGIPIPPGDWLVVASDGYVPTLKNLGNDQESDSVPQGAVILVSAESAQESHPVRFVYLRLPLGVSKNRTWLTSLPSICNPEWNKSFSLSRDFFSLSNEKLDCRAIYVGRVFSWSDFLTNSGKVGLNILGISYDKNDNYILSGTFISKNSSIIFVTYGEWVDGKKYSNASEFREQNDSLVVAFQARANRYNELLKQASDEM